MVRMEVSYWSTVVIEASDWSMTHRVEDGEKERSASHDLVEDDVGVQRDVLVKGPLLHLGNQVPSNDKQLQSKPSHWSK